MQSARRILLPHLDSDWDEDIDPQDRQPIHEVLMMVRSFARFRQPLAATVHRGPGNGEQSVLRSFMQAASSGLGSGNNNYDGDDDDDEEDDNNNR